MPLGAGRARDTELQSATAPCVQQSAVDAAGNITNWNQQRGDYPVSVNAFDYDAANQLLDGVITQGGTTVHQYGYQYDPAGNRTVESIDGAAVPAGFNNLNQLVALGRSTGAMIFSGHLNHPGKVSIGGASPVSTSGTDNHFMLAAPVAMGTNALPIQAYTTSGSSVQTASGHILVTATAGAGSRLNYDLDGNLIFDGSKSYEWDAGNRLTRIGYGATGASASTAMAYDGLGRRVQFDETESSGAAASTKSYVWEGMSIAEEKDAAGSITKQYFAQGVRISGSNYYYTRDHLGSIREVTDASGAVVARYDYDPYGRQVQVSGTLVADFGYTGDYFHQPSQLCLTVYRAYSPNLGRWLNRDPIGERGGINLYDYVLNDSVGATDVLGLTSQCKKDCPKSLPKGDSHWKNDSSSSSIVGTITRNITHCGEDCYREEVATGSRHCCYDKNGSPTDDSMKEDHNPNFPGQFWPHCGEAVCYYLSPGTTVILNPMSCPYPPPL